MQRWFPILLAAAVVLSCGRGYRLQRDAVAEPSTWPYYHGDIAATGVIQGGDFQGQFDILWERKSNDKLSAPMTIAGGSLIYPGCRSKIKYFDLENGNYLGRIKVRGTPQTGVAVTDSLACYALAPPRNVLYCKNLHNGKTVWRRSVKDAVPGSIIVDNRLIVSSGDGTTVAIGVDNGDLLWTFNSESRFSAPPSFANGRIFQPANDGTLYAISVDDGRELFRTTLDGPLVNAASIVGKVYIADIYGNIYCLKPDDGEVLWKVSVAGPVWTSPAVNDKTLLIGHSGGELVALEAATGKTRWTFDAVDVIKASPIVIGQQVVFGTLGGMIYSLDVATGRQISSRDVKEAIAYPAVSDGNRVYVATQKGRVFCFGKFVRLHSEENQ